VLIVALYVSYRLLKYSCAGPARAVSDG
jgi:hypothetical protein